MRRSDPTASTVVADPDVLTWAYTGTGLRRTP
jgi:hypothetical protein